MSEYPIYDGVWINWSRGATLGWTLTLGFTEAQLLTNFLGIFVTIVGAQSWRIVSFVIHQLRAAPIPGNRQHQQAQVVLHNTSSALGAAWEFVLLGWPWSKALSSGPSSVLILALLAVLHSSVWGLAGIFSSKVTQYSGHDALLKSSNCGFYVPANASDSAYSEQFFSSQSLNTTLTGASYARVCYGDTNNTQGCSQYVVPRIPWTSNPNASCPFDSEFCKLKDTAAAFEMDTGMMESDRIFGINTPSSERVGYRKLTTCAPVHVPDDCYRVENNTSKDRSPGNETFFRFYLGSSNETEFTYQYSLSARKTSSDGYQLYIVHSLGSSWIPIPQLNRTDADVTLYFLAANSITYRETVDDPFFSAHIPGPASVGGYLSDNYVHILGCVDRHQFCNLNPKAGNQSCTPLTKLDLILAWLEGDQNVFSQLQAPIVARLLPSMLSSSMFESITSEASLQAYSSLYQGFQGHLPNNQWQIEVTSWFNVALAKLQDSVVQYSKGPSSLRPGSIIDPPADRFDKALCNAQKVGQNLGHISFSLLGVVLILIFGSFIILVSFFVDTLVGSIQRRVGRGTHKALQWVLDEKLQLLRMVYEKADIGTWENCDGKIPVTNTEIEHMGVVTSGAGGKHPSYEKDLATGVASTSPEESLEEELEGDRIKGYSLVNSA